jgi:sec-independent protein translocase protein TatA
VFENLGPMELMLILVIVLVLFGARRVPEIGASIGKGIREFKKGLNEIGAHAGEGDARPAPPRAPAERVVHADDSEREPKRLLVK